jgi:hypothetical protein
MANVISYRPAIGKQKLEKIIKNKLHYKNLNQFIDHAVSKTLNEEMGSHHVVRKITHEVEKAIYKYVPMKFINATGSKDAKGIEESVKRTDKKGGWASTEELMKKHNIR